MRTVPTATFGPILEHLIHQRWPDRDSEGIAILAEKVGCSWDAIDGIIRQQHEGCEFNLADELLCALGMSLLWREEPLADIYFNIDLSRTVCANPGCKIEFHDPHYAELAPAFCVYEGCKEEPHARGLCNRHWLQARRDGVLHTFPRFYSGRLTMYCSTACRQSASQMTRGITTRRRKRYLDTKEKCRNGHKRTPENTRLRKNGKMECAICAREANKASYHRRKREAVSA